MKKLKEEYSNPDVSKDTLEFVPSLPVERKIPRVTELETIHATPEQQEEMEKRLLKEQMGSDLD